MKNSGVLRLLSLGFLFLAVVAAVPLAAQPVPEADRYLDHAAVSDGHVRLVVFNPESFNIRALVALRKNGIIDIPNLVVVGVYHTRQTGDFAAARKFVADQGLDWFKFHVVTAEIGEADAYKANACLPEFEKIIRKSDGVIFFGGPDIPPSVFGRKTNLLTEIEDPYRHWLELSAVFHFLGGSQDATAKPLLDTRPGFPILGICLGFQTLNVGTGGTLIQDIWSELYGKPYVEDVIALGPEQWHNNPYRRLYPVDKLMGYNFHTLQLGDGSKFVKAMGFKVTDHPRILSSHHQAADGLGQGLVAAAASRDGKVVEAVEHAKYPNVLGVQFHPEHPMLWDATPQFRQKPGDPLTSYNAILAGTPPSLEFNKGIWKWFAGRLVASHGK
ncbi:MAG TPA: gamma-glutamyl-gamma-aminobutyrate hydrolase family protein [Terriglobales bacterium]|nr:gamma-glutamyl-gamma-aminobutyrate hydrolase family protein [Terriglobales bacterium]